MSRDDDGPREAAIEDPTGFVNRTAGGREVDILIERGDGSVCGVEVKLGASARSDDFAALRHRQSKLGPRFKLGAVVHRASSSITCEAPPAEHKANHAARVDGERVSLAR